MSCWCLQFCLHISPIKWITLRLLCLELQQEVQEACSIRLRLRPFISKVTEGIRNGRSPSFRPTHRPHHEPQLCFQYWPVICLLLLLHQRSLMLTKALVKCHILLVLCQKDVILNSTAISWCVGLCFISLNLYEMHKLPYILESNPHQFLPIS